MRARFLFNRIKGFHDKSKCNVIYCKYSWISRFQKVCYSTSFLKNGQVQLPDTESLKEYTLGPSVTEKLDYELVGYTGGELFHEMLARHGVPCVFGYPGGAVLPVLDAIHDTKHFDFILPRHEQAGGHMAQGFARVTGKPGVCLVTSGPGATNIVTPMQDALMDGTPLVVFCGQVPSTMIGTDAFQEANMIEISKPCTKWNIRVEHVKDLPCIINKAFEVAVSGRPGPVLVELPKDVTSSKLQVAVPFHDTHPAYPAFKPHSTPPARVADKNLAKAADLLNSASRPLLYVGQGVLQTANGPALVRELMETCGIPATTTLLGIGGVDERLYNSLGMLGMHGTVEANLAMQNADVIVALGARFDDRVTGNLQGFAPAAHEAARSRKGGIIHFDILQSNINKIVPATISVLGDMSHTLSAFVKLVHTANDKRVPSRHQWNASLMKWKRKYGIKQQKTACQQEEPLATHVLNQLQRKINESYSDKKVIITTGVGQHQMWAAQHFDWKPSMSFITSGGLGTMGFGLPAAIGAKVANPDALVIDVDGDASFSMTAMELVTAAQFNIGVKIVLLNNSFQGMVKQWQDLFYEERYSGTKMFNPDFVRMAESMQCKGIKVENISELDSALDEFLKESKPVVLEVKTPVSEHVYPMVAVGKALHEMDLGKNQSLAKDDVFIKKEN